MESRWALRQSADQLGLWGSLTTNFICHRVTNRRTDFDEVLYLSRALKLLNALNRCICNRLDKHSYRPNRIVVTRNNIVDAIRVTVGVNDTDYWDAELVGLCNGNTLMVNVNNKNDIGQPAHIFDTTEADLELVKIALA